MSYAVYVHAAADGSSGFRLEPPTSGSGTLAGSDEATSFLEGSWRLDFMRQERRSASQEGQSVCGPGLQLVDAHFIYRLLLAMP
jgi:hypothetical protein